MGDEAQGTLPGNGLTAEAVYDMLAAAGPAAVSLQPFDRHLLASILAIGFHQTETEGGSLAAAVGLDPADLADLVDRVFPQAAALFAARLAPAPLRGADEETLIDLLRTCGTMGSPLEALLAQMVARRAQRPNHLWQDLGLQNRGELSTLMSQHFAPLAKRNNRDMKWKKFLYRTICRDGGYALCTAPSCSECDDFDACFSEETGESFLARARRAAELSA